MRSLLTTLGAGSPNSSLLALMESLLLRTSAETFAFTSATLSGLMKLAWALICQRALKTTHL